MFVSTEEGAYLVSEPGELSSAILMKHSTLLARASLVFWISFVFLHQYFDRTRPRSPDLQRTYPWGFHGHTVYLNATDNYGLFLLVAAAVGCLLGVFFTKAQSKARMD